MVVNVSNLVKRYKDVLALDHFNLEIQEGEVYGLLGPNGSGKTTAMNCILSLLNYDKGDIRIFDKKMTPTSYELKSKIGVVFQNVAVFDELTVYDNIDYFCGLYIREKDLRRQYVEDAIDFVGLGDFRSFYPKKLSGGLLRRLNIACGIAHKPKLIFMDEPTVAVDPQSRNKILEGIQRLNEDGATIIYTSHYMEEVEQICTKITIMDHGKALATGTKDELKAMIRTGDMITVHVLDLPGEVLSEIESLPHVFEANYCDNILSVKCTKGKHNLIHILDKLKEHDISFDNVFSQLPTLNDVFLEITGTELRD